MDMPQGFEVESFTFYNDLTPEKANWVVQKLLKEGLKVFRKYYTDSGRYSVLTWKYTDEATYQSYKESLAKENFREIEVGGVRIDYPIGY
jgi:hypothetical protein